MSTIEATERKLARRHAVDEAYHALERYQVNRRRIVFVTDDCKRAGGYGIVRQAHLHPSPYLPVWLASRRYGPPQVVAVKQIKISAIDNVSDVKRAFTKELLVWSDFTHSEAWLISPWEPYGNISEFTRGRKLEVPEKLSLVHDTVDALTFLHQANPPICHGDIKSANVLVNAKCRAVLCDFGLARLYEDSGFGRLETSDGFKGSIRWCSPELLEGQPRTPRSDVYAWAWLVWEIMTGEQPYEGAEPDYVIIRKIFESPRPQVDGESRLSDCLQVWELISRCWTGEPGQRPTSSMCRTTVTFLPRCPPTPGCIDHQARSAALLENLGDLESWKGNYDDGLAHLEQALRLYEQEGDDRGIASVLQKQASISYRHSYHVQTLKAASAAFKKFKKIGDPLGAAESLYLIGSALTVQSQELEAAFFLEEALAIFRNRGSDVGVVQCLERLGEIQRRNGQSRQALITLEEAVQVACRCGDRLGEVKALIIIAATHQDRDDLEKAASILSEACDTSRRIGWEYGVCTALWDLGTLQMKERRWSEAEEVLRESISIARRIKAPWRLAQVLGALGQCLRSQQRIEEAIKALEESCSAYLDVSLPNDFAQVATLLADLKHVQGAKRNALHWYDVAIAQYRRLRNRYQLSASFGAKAKILNEIEQYDEAVLYFEASVVLDMELKYYYDIPWNQKQLSLIPKTSISWASCKPHQVRTAEVQQMLPLLCDVKKIQRRIPQLTSPSLKLDIRIGERDKPYVPCEWKVELEELDTKARHNQVTHFLNTFIAP